VDSIHPYAPFVFLFFSANIHVPLLPCCVHQILDYHLTGRCEIDIDRSPFRSQGYRGWYVHMEEEMDSVKCLFSLVSY